MRIGVFGATGAIGGQIVVEAVARGHQITAFTRDPARFGPTADSVTWQVADALDPASIASAIDGLDVVVSAINAGRDVPETIANADVFPRAASAMIEALTSRPDLRVIVMGGAGSLEVAPGVTVVEAEGFAENLPKALGVPVEYVNPVRAGVEALNRYRTSNRNWTYLSPSAGRIEPGERTGRFRIGGDQLLVRADGTSDISLEDLAMAVVDEAETARHVKRRFTVGY
ncbi:MULTISPECIES: NAD(P)-dependent oxidoreductase [Glycomyces]|uniref:NAD(P)H-binding protein n=2 Tax=Glycomyces TaxID=58113 RepID=A0A9X3PY73_9ACTN|nr:NAD(P)H-binding protein [Glycomyces lechevalierae]MDA1388253.1 NAD(P)H-binding protein [Glycomyces lechevalierae]MDR7337305.1 putative NADH-flavin reductase [Glycomyces lechevalierae]